MERKVKNALTQSFLDSFEAPWTGSIDSWAHEFVSLPSNYAVQGSFDASISRYLFQPFQDLKDPDVVQVNCVAATQTGKTLISEIFLPWIITQSPGPVLKLHQTDEMANLFTTTRVIPMMMKCQPVKTLIEEDRYIAQKSFINLPHMSIKISGQKENILHGQSIRYLLMDEVWLYNLDVVQKAKARTTAFGNNKKIVLTSQPGIEGDQLDEENKGLEYTWGWQCPHCNTTQSFYWSKEKDDGTWAGVVWDKYYVDVDSSSYDFQKTGDSARLQCYYCTGSLKDTEENRRYLNDTGLYIQTADHGNNKIHTYKWCAFVNQKISFKEKVIEYLQAVIQNRKYGTTDALKTFTQQVLGQNWKRAAAIDQNKVLVQTFDPDAAWPEQVFRCLSVDYQKKFGLKFWAVVAFSRNEIRVLDHGLCNKWDEINTIAKKYKIPPPAVGIDSGYHATEVYLEAYNHGEIVKVGKRIDRVGWTCFKGDDKDDGYPHAGPNGDKIIKYFSPLTRASVTNTQYARLFRWANYPIKNILYHIKEGKSEMKLVLPTPDPDFTHQLNSETLQEVIDAKTGLKKLRWEKVHDDNHFLDVMCQAIVLCLMADKFGMEPTKISLPPQPDRKS